MPRRSKAIPAAEPPRPTRQELLAAVDKRLKDVITPNLRVLFCGINPGLYSAATSHHFARPGNRFWPALFTGGFTPRVLKPWEEQELLACGCGITNLVARASATAAELTVEELKAGGRRLVRKVNRYRPQWVAIVGVEAYRKAFADPQATIGRQLRMLGPAQVWVLPNPSGLNAHYQAAALGRLFGELCEASRQVQPRIRKMMNKSGIGTPSSHSRM